MTVPHYGAECEGHQWEVGGDWRFVAARVRRHLNMMAHGGSYVVRVWLRPP